MALACGHNCAGSLIPPRSSPRLQYRGDTPTLDRLGTREFIWNGCAPPRSPADLGTRGLIPRMPGFAKNIAQPADRPREGSDSLGRGFRRLRPNLSGGTSPLLPRELLPRQQALASNGSTRHPCSYMRGHEYLAITQAVHLAKRLILKRTPPTELPGVN